MALVSGRLIDGKPLVEVSVADARPQAAALTPQFAASQVNFALYRGLLDTGADITCVCDHVVRERKLKLYGFERMVGAVGPSLHESYVVSLGIVCGDLIDPQLSERSVYLLDPLIAVSIRDNQWFDLIIGTDVLSHHEFTLTRGGGFRLNLF